MSSLLRSTKFVRYFTGAARTLLLNSAKTAETNLLINSKALCAANNVLMRDYATKKTESLEPLLQKLDSEVRRFGRITKKDIDEVFDEIRSRDDITSSQSLLVIRCCGELVPEELPEQRTLLVQKIWSVLTERGIPMDISHYNALLRVYLENEHLFSPAQFLEELEKKGLQPNRVTYQRLMWRYCQEGDVEGATKVLEKMRELNFPVSEPVLNALVMGHAFHGDTDGAKAVLETMAKAGLQPTNRTYTLLACGYAKKGDIEGINDVLKIASDSDAVITDKDVLEIIEHLAISGHGDKVEQLFPHLQKNVGYNQEVCNLVLRLLNKGQLATAKKMLPTMTKSEKAEETPFKGAFVVKQLVRIAKTPEEIVKTCIELKEEGLVPNAIFIATENAIMHGRADLAQALFVEYEKEGYEVRPHFYWPLLARKVKENDEEGLLQILRDMNKKSFGITGEALRDYIIPYLLNKDSPQNVIAKLQLANVPTVHSARNLIVELLDRGNIKEAAKCTLQYQPKGNFATMARPLLNALSKTNDVHSFVTILHVISQKRQNQIDEESGNEDVQKDDSIINEVSRLVTTAVKVMNNVFAEQLLKELLSKGVRITVRAAENIEQYLGESLTTTTSELLSKLTSSELESVPINAPKFERVRTTAEMEQLLAQLKNKEGANVNRLLKQLLNAYIVENNVEKVDNHLKELKSMDFQLTTLQFAQLYEFYCQNNEIEKAKQCEAEMRAKNPEFVLNKQKLVTMAIALVKTERFDEAVKLLKEAKFSDESDINFQLNSKCWQLLNSLAEMKDVDKVKEIVNILISQNYVVPSNVILGPLIKVHLLRDDLDAALKEFENCCTQYQSTPWKGELMKALIMKEDANKLQWLADLSTQIHGEVNILHDLVLAFVECGRLRQARRILETPGMHTKNQRLDNACQRYVEEGKSEYLEGLLEATKELSHIDRSNIFYHLLVTYCKSDETDKALGLWTLLQEEGEVPSEQFLIYLGNHLKAKNRPVPFVIPTSKRQTNAAKMVQKENPVDKVITKTPNLTKPTKLEVSLTIENLVQEGQLNKAFDLTMKTFKSGVVPKPNVLRYLTKSLAMQGEVQTLEKLGSVMNENMKREVGFDDKLTQAIFEKGGAVNHVNELLKSVKEAKSDDELLNALRRFPRSNALASLIDNKELLGKCQKVAEIAATNSIITPINILWMEYLIAGKEKEAHELWNKYLVNANAIIFRRLLQESFVKKEPKLNITLIEYLKTNKNISKGSLGNAYSRLISTYINENQVDEAEKCLDEAIKLGVETNQINKNIFTKLKSLVEESGKKFKYQV